MIPTFKPGQYILTNKIIYQFQNPKAGDVIIFRAPNQEESDYIKRIIALPGDRVKLDQGYFYINGSRLNETGYLGSSIETEEEQYLREGMEILLSPNQYFVAGDNRSSSSDSRQFGPIVKKSIIGKAWLRYWPLSAVSVVNKIKAQASETSNVSLNSETIR